MFIICAQNQKKWQNVKKGTLKLCNVTQICEREMTKKRPQLFLPADVTKNSLDIFYKMV